MRTKISSCAVQHTYTISNMEIYFTLISIGWTLLRYGIVSEVKKYSKTQKISSSSSGQRSWENISLRQKKFFSKEKMTEVVLFVSNLFEKSASKKYISPNKNE